MDTIEFTPPKPKTRTLLTLAATAGVLAGFVAGATLVPTVRASADGSRTPGSVAQPIAAPSPTVGRAGTPPSAACVPGPRPLTPAERRAYAEARHLMPMSADAISEWLQGREPRRPR